MERLPYIQIAAEGGKTMPEDVMRNLATLLGTRRGEQVLDRSFGISWEALDKPIPEAQRLLRLDIMRQIMRYETRVRPVSVNFVADNAQGILEVKVVIALA